MHKFLLEAVECCACSQPTYIHPTNVGPLQPLCFEGDNLFLGALAVLKHHQSKIWCYLREIVVTNPAAMYSRVLEEVCPVAPAQPWTLQSTFLQTDIFVCEG